jgi:hypothetical protein
MEEGGRPCSGTVEMPAGGYSDFMENAERPGGVWSRRRKTEASECWKPSEERKRPSVGEDSTVGSSGWFLGPRTGASGRTQHSIFTEQNIHLTAGCRYSLHLKKYVNLKFYLDPLATSNS